jgi:hypothetical protein
LNSRARINDFTTFWAEITESNDVPQFKLNKMKCLSLIYTTITKDAWKRKNKYSTVQVTITWTAIEYVNNLVLSQVFSPNNTQ